MGHIVQRPREMGLELPAPLGQYRRAFSLQPRVGLKPNPPMSWQHVIMDGASGFLVSLFGERGVPPPVGRQARSSLGVAELPLNIAVEVEMAVETEGLS